MHGIEEKLLSRAEKRLAEKKKTQYYRRKILSREKHKLGRATMCTSEEYCTCELPYKSYSSYIPLAGLPEPIQIGKVVGRGIADAAEAGENFTGALC